MPRRKAERSGLVNSADRSIILAPASFEVFARGVNRPSKELVVRRMSHYCARSCFRSGSDGDDTSLALPAGFGSTLIVSDCHKM